MYCPCRELSLTPVIFYFTTDKQGLISLCFCCSDQDVCQLTSDSGPCKASIPRWFYDYNDGICKEFVYGGCEGNKNNYETREACESTCSRQRKILKIFTKCIKIKIKSQSTLRCN